MMFRCSALTRGSTRNKIGWLEGDRGWERDCMRQREWDGDPTVVGADKSGWWGKGGRLGIC